MRSATSVFGDVLRARPAVLFDGALATELERSGADLSDALWSARLLLDDPSRIVAVHESYLRAGVDVLTSASYQASREGFARRGLSHKDADALMARSVQLAREAMQRAGRSALVAASLGPHGATLADGSEYTGATSLIEAQLVEFHRPRLEAVWSAAPDLVLFETVPSLREVRAIARLARSYPEVPVMVSCSALSPRSIAHGETFGAVLAELEACTTVIAAGINCAPPACVAPLLARGASSRALRSAMPNRGERWNAQKRAWEGDEVFDAAAWARTYIEAGARIVGGCCRTRPDDCAAMRATIDAA